LTALAEAPAELEFSDALSVEAALAESVDCSQVSQVLLASGEVPGKSLYASCDAACALLACVGAVGNLWANARDASSADNATLSITASGATQVGDTAEVTRLSGTWLGELVIGAQTALASGAFSATTSAP
jgi:hypothetical protein